MVWENLEIRKMAAAVAPCFLFALLPIRSLEAPTRSQAPPKTFVYAPVPQPVNGILQYGQAADGKLTPLKPPLVVVHSPYVPVSVTDPKGHFIYLGTSPLRQFHVSSNGHLVPLKPATVSSPETNAMAFTPDGRFVYLSHTHSDYYGPTNTPDDLIICRVATDGSLHPIQGGVIHTGPQVTALAVDRTERFLYVCVYNYDPSGNLAYTMEYRINQDGTLGLLHTDEYNCVPAPAMLIAAPSGPFMYMASNSGISTWRIKPDGTLHLLQSESVYMQVPAFVLDARDNILIGIGKAVPGSDFGADQLVVWHRLPDGTLTEPFGVFIAKDGFLYGNEKDMPKGSHASPVGIAFDSGRSMLYVRDSATDRIFRYRVASSGSLRLQVPWVATGVQTLEVRPEDDPLFLGKGN